MLYVNRIGLPDFIKNPILEKLHARGIDLQFSRLRLRWQEGIVAENVRFGGADEKAGPQMTLREIKVLINSRALAQLKLQVDALTLRQGRLTVSIPETNAPAREVAIEDIQTNLRFLPQDKWALDDFTARFAGAKIRLSGTVAHASSVRDWKFFSNQKPQPRGTLQNRFRQLADTLEKIHFSTAPELNLILSGDAREPQSFTIRMLINAPDARTPWGTVNDGHFMARLEPSLTNDISRAELRLEARGAGTAWGTISNLNVVVHLASIEKTTDLVKAQLSLLAGEVETKWGSTRNIQFNADWINAFTNAVPLSGQGKLSCETLQTTLIEEGKIQKFEGLARLSGNSISEPASNWGWWTNIVPYNLDLQWKVFGVHSKKLEADVLAGTGTWRAPELAVTNLEGTLYGGQLKGGVQLNVATRELKASVHSDVDPHSVEPLLTEGGRRFLDQFTWEKPPDVSAITSLTLPAWTNQHPDWRAEVQPTLKIDGAFTAERGGAFREVPVSTAQSHFTYSNMEWHLPDLAVTRPEGRLLASHIANDRTKDFYWKIESSLDPRIVKPLLNTNIHRHFDLVGLTQAPVLSGEIWGRFHEPERVGVKAKVAVTNFTFRGEKIGALQASVEYTNKYLLLTQGQAQYGTQHVSASSVAFDIPAGKIYLSNGISTADPQVVARAIGPKIGRIVEPYHFVHPPKARVYGIIPTKNESDADLHFDLDGGPFQWFKFNVSQVAGHVHWKGDRLALENVHGEFYHGNAVGSATFDFSPEHRTDFQFNLNVTNAVLQFLMADISPHTNNLEGRLSGTLIVNKANSSDWQSWQGGGQASLKNGLLWEIPVFGIFSPVLNTIAPGLGNSPATAAAGTFTITNGVVVSDDLEIRSPAMRLQYRGTVDLQGRVNARVEAELLRDMWLLGPFVSTVFWPVTKLFEYKLAGTLAKPKSEQAYLVSKIFFHPFKTLKEVLPEEPGPVRTNPPP